MDQEREGVDAQFFIDELARIANDNDRRYIALSKRVSAIEDNSRSVMSIDENPMGAVLGVMLIMVICETVLPLLIEGVRRWRSPSLPSSE